jgi:hypothetical protein
MTPDKYFREKERRSGIDRRQFSYALHIPERRKNGERRRSRRKSDKRLQEALPLADPAPPPWTPPFSI